MYSVLFLASSAPRDHAVEINEELALALQCKAMPSLSVGIIFDVADDALASLRQTKLLKLL